MSGTRAGSRSQTPKVMFLTTVLYCFPNIRVQEKPPKQINGYVFSIKSTLLIATLGWLLATPKEGHKLLLSGLRGTPESRD